MKENILLLIFICLFINSTCTGQSRKASNKELESCAKLFIEKFSTIINEGSVARLKSEMIVSKQEFRNFLNDEWKRKYNAYARKKIQDKFEPSVEKGWNQIQKNDGYILLGSIVKGNDAVSSEKIINPTFKNCKFSETTVNISETYDSSIGEISMLRLINISTLVVTDSYPNYTYRFNFPCILTSDGNLKIIGFVNGKLVSINN